MWLPDPEARAPAPMKFRMDVVENDREYQVIAEMPGVKKEEISITISGNEVAVSTEVKHEKDIANGETVLRAERYYGKIERASRLVRKSTKRMLMPSPTTACWNLRCRRRQWRGRKNSR